MAHVQTNYLGLWKPQDLGLDKINSQKMFIDNINLMEAFGLSMKQGVYPSVKSLADLRAINTSDTTLFKTGMLIMVQDNGIYSFNRVSTADDDNNAIIKPTVGSGRWITTTTTDIPLGMRQLSSDSELDGMLTTILQNMSDNAIKFIVIKAVSGTTPPFYGGNIHMTIYKINNLYATMTAIVYNMDRNARQFTRVRYDGIWGGWTALPFLDATGKIPLDQLPSGVLPASIE